MIVGIDAANIRSDGGVTHLVEMLAAANPPLHDISKVVLWAGKRTLSQVADRPWLVKSHQPMLDSRLPIRTFWQRFRLAALARDLSCDVLFVPGGAFGGDFQPVVAFSQNLQPFEWPEVVRFGWSWTTVKVAMLRFVQTRTFRRANGLIFLTKHAHDVVMPVLGHAHGMTTIIPHGVHPRFVCAPRAQQPISNYSFEKPFRILYVSTVSPYKCQWKVAEAVSALRKSGVPVELELIGAAYRPSFRRLKRTLNRLDPEGRWVRYSGFVPHEELPERYRQADLFVFASTCEAFGQVLLEAMATALPIACADRSAMPEVLGDAGAYFDPEDENSIFRALQLLIQSPELRAAKAAAAFQRAQGFSWDQCALDTFQFLADATRRAPR